MTPLLTAEEVGALLQMDPRAVLRSSIPRVRLGHRTIRFRREDVQSWVAEQVTGGRDPGA